MRTLAILVLLAALALAGCSSQPQAPATPQKNAAGEYEIRMTGSNLFDPPRAQVPVGATVRWVNPSSAPHDVQADGGAFSSGGAGGVGEGESFAHTFTQPGTYTYHCIIHLSTGMKGTLTVA